jgi:hypothetical protein
MDLDVQTGGWFQKGFTGCIKSFIIQKKRINFQRDSVRTANLVIVHSFILTSITKTFGIGWSSRIKPASILASQYSG